MRTRWAGRSALRGASRHLSRARGRLGAGTRAALYEGVDAPGSRRPFTISESGSTLAANARDAFVVGMRYAVGVGAVLLVLGAVFVWYRGATRTEEVSEDELDDEVDLVDVLDPTAV